MSNAFVDRYRGKKIEVLNMIIIHNFLEGILLVIVMVVLKIIRWSYERELNFRRTKFKTIGYWQWQTINFVIMSFMVSLLFNFRVILSIFSFLFFFFFLEKFTFSTLRLMHCFIWAKCLNTAVSFLQHFNHRFDTMLSYQLF